MNQPLRHAVFLDIDGTVLDIDSQSLSSTVCRVLTELRRRGHAVFINTGRAPGYVPYGILPAECFDGICAGLGSYADYNGKILYENPIDEADVRKLIAYCDGHKETCFLESEKDELNGRYSFLNNGTFHVQRFYDTPDALFRAIGKLKIYKITIPYLPNTEYRAFLNQHFTMCYCTATEQQEFEYAEGAAIGCDKGYAVKRVCELLNIPIERSIAIGDSENDLGMLRAAGTSVAMGNAPDGVKSACTVVTESVKNDGAAHALIRLLAPELENTYFA